MPRCPSLSAVTRRRAFGFTIHDSRTPPQPTLAPLDLVGRSGAVLIRRGLDTYHSMWIGTRRIAASQPVLYRHCMANHPAARRAHPMIRQVSALLMLFPIPHGHVNGLSEVNRANRPRDQRQKMENKQPTADRGREACLLFELPRWALGEKRRSRRRDPG